MGKGTHEPDPAGLVEVNVDGSSSANHQKLATDQKSTNPSTEVTSSGFLRTDSDETDRKTDRQSESRISDEAAATEARQAAEERERQRREQEPLLFCKLITKYPLRSFLMTLGGHMLMVFISVILVASGYDLLPIDFENLPLEILDQPWLPRDLAFRQRDDYSGYYNRTPAADPMTETYARASLQLFYDTKGGNVFTKSNLEKIQEIENSLVALSGFSDYCQINSGGTCNAPWSIIRYFDGTYSALDANFNDPNFNNIPTVLYTALNNNYTKSSLQFFLSKNYYISSTEATSEITRSVISLGYPMAGLSDEEYEKKVRTYSANSIKPLLESIRSNTNEFEVSYRSYLLWVEDVFNQAMKDVLCAVGSICFIFFFILVHTKSLWITGFSVLSVLTSFVATNLIYRVVLDFRYIGFFHILTLFIVLGIGADDIFVFFDVWRNTAYESYPSFAHRMSDAYRRSAFSMFFTSLTTSVAFFASAISPLLATRSFGIFSGIVIIVNYLSVIIYFPTVVAMYHTKFENFKWPCIQFCKTKCKKHCTCCSKQKSETHVVSLEDTRQQHIPENSDQVTNTQFSKQGLPQPMVLPTSDIYRSKSQLGEKLGTPNPAFVEDLDSEPSEKQKVMEDRPKTASFVPKKRKEKGVMVRFFRNTYFGVVTHKIYRWLILALMAGVLIFFIYQASFLEPDNEGLKVLKESHVYRVAEAHNTDSFVESDRDNTLIIYILWGMKQQDMGGCHFSESKCLGSLSWDTSFNPNSADSQTALLNFCNKMFSFTDTEANDYRIRKDYTSGEYQINCFIKNLDTFLQAESVSTSTDWNLTYDYTKAVSFMNARTTYYDSSTFTSAYEDYLEIPISYWLSNKYTNNYTDDFYLFDHLIGEEEAAFSSTLKTDSNIKYGNDIRYIAMQVNTTIKYRTLGYNEGIPIMDRWENFINNEMSAMPDGLKGGFQLTTQIWHWMVVQKMLAENAVYGIIIGVCVAFPILTIATMNIIIGFLATLSMSCSTVCVIGVIPLGGWKLGVLVSLNMCMVVGLTVDYVVHLAEAYARSQHRDRLSRVQDMLDEMGVSIFFGACTTLGASLFMFIAQLSFFFQFGIFMFSTVGFSLFFSMGLFVTLMGIVGPENDIGNIRVAAQKARDWCKRRRQNT